jgi:hypothetical protein
MRCRIENRPTTRSATGVVVLVLLAAACTGAPTAATPTATTSATPPVASAATSNPAPTSTSAAAVPRTIAPSYTPVINPAEFSTTIDNPYFPLVPGTRFIYEATTADGRERNVVEVTADTNTVMAVATRVVHDIVLIDGKPEEETYDWYAQDTEGNVWYFGEATKALGGPTVDTSGSFEAGQDGALPGIVMPGHPMVGDHYRQEYYKGEAEDTGKVLSLTGNESTPFTGPRSALLVTEDINPLDPAAAVENKYYAEGVGLLITVQVTGPAERSELVAIEKF